jgi:ABC-type multidrug transport system fused ATPase/permease subunit
MPPETQEDPTLTVEQEERASGMRTLRKMIPYLWPDDKPWVKRRVVWSMVALVMSKLVATSTPFLSGWVVDVLADERVSVWTLGAIGLAMAYGLARLMNVGFQQLRDAIFAPVAQRALRTLALETFKHIHQLSMRYHITRKTGGLSRIIERGVKGVEFLLRFLLFSIGPLVLELLLAAIVFSAYFDIRFLGVLVATIAVYIWFTFKVTEWRVKLRREMNDQDTDANQKAVDSLLNYETVKYFGAEAREAARYDGAMAGYEAAALKTS